MHPTVAETLLSFLVLLLLAGLAAAGWFLWQHHRQRTFPVVTLPIPPPDPFSTQQITQTFIAALPTLTRELNLEVASSTQTEAFERRDQKSTLWGLLDLGTNTVQLRVAVTYRYHLRLADAWRLEARDGHLIVHAPVVRPSLPPALHTDQWIFRPCAAGAGSIQRNWCAGSSMTSRPRSAAGRRMNGILPWSAKPPGRAWPSSWAGGWKAKAAGGPAATGPSRCGWAVRPCRRLHPPAACS